MCFGQNPARRAVQVISDAEGSQKDFEKRTKTKLRAIVDALLNSQSQVAAVTSSTARLQSNVQLDKQEGATLLRDLLSATTTAIDAVKEKDRARLEKAGAAFGEADSRARRKSGGIMKRTEDEYRDNLKQIIGVATSKVKQDTAKVLDEAKRASKQVKQVERIVSRQAERTEQKSSELRSLGTFFNKQWKEVGKEETAKVKEFDEDLKEMEKKQITETRKVKKKVDKGTKEAVTRLVGEFEGVRWIRSGLRCERILV